MRWRLQGPGKDEEDADRILEDAIAGADAGAYAVVLEGIPPARRAHRKHVPIPTIGIALARIATARCWSVTTCLA